MENTDKKFNNLVNKLNRINPQLINPIGLTDSIMAAIHPSEKKSSKTVLRWIRPILAAASVFLVGLFLYQHTDENTHNMIIAESAQPKIGRTFLASSCFEQNNSEIKNNKNRVQQYLCYMRQSEQVNQKSKLFLLKQISKYQKNIPH
jgi:hypothetical protein